MSEKRNPVDLVREAERILVGKKGERSNNIKWLQNEAGLDVPNFPGKTLSATSEGRTYTLMRGADISGLVARDIADVGLPGSDQAREFDLKNPGSINYQLIGQTMGRLVLAVPTASDAQFEEAVDRQASLVIGTSYEYGATAFAENINPNMRVGALVSGSVEELIRLGMADVVYELTETGESLTTADLSVVRIDREVRSAVVSAAVAPEFQRFAA